MNITTLNKNIPKIDGDNNIPAISCAVVDTLKNKNT